MLVPDPPVPLVLADDLSGAAETGAALLSRRTRTRILLTGAAATPEDLATTDAVPVLDLDSRLLPPDAARARAAAAVAQARPGALIYFKIDSMLRGNVAAAVAVLAGQQAPVVVTPALPVGGRTVRDGILHIDGVPLHRTGAWHVEAGAPPQTLAAALAPLPVAVVDLATVRGPALPDALRAVTARGGVAVCDAETDTDLDAVVAAALTLPGVRLAGSGGLAAALGRRWRRSCGPERGDEGPVHPVDPAQRALLVVVGTAAPGAGPQVQRLVDERATHVGLPVEVLTASRPSLAPPEPGVTVVTVRPPVRPGAARRVVAGLAEAVAAAVDAADVPVDLVLTGGETARRVLDALKVTELEPLGQVHHGAVVTRTRDGRRVVTRPGSFGDADSLLAIARTLQTQEVHP